MKKIPIGRDNFKEIIQNDYYYIDKTKMIEEILNDGFQVNLFTRPRRFGKSLNISMLQSFFDVSKKEENRKLFEGLYIEESEAFSEQGKYPVISISFKGTEGMTWEDAHRQITAKISNLYNDYKYLREELDQRNLEIFDNFWMNRKGLSWETALSDLAGYLADYWGEQVIILIDEYDDPIISANEKGYYEEAVTFFKNLYSGVLKSNPHVKTGVLTGIVRVAQAGIFSDLNNFTIHTILEPNYDEYFGFTETEVIKALEDYKLIENFDEVKEWYDGYKFGNMEIYNPWSILNYLYYQKLKPYWVNTSSNSLILELLRKSDKETVEKLQELIEGGETVTTMSAEVSLDRRLDQSKLWEFMVFSGYLKVKEQLSISKYILQIPNHEVKTMFETMFVDITMGEKSSIDILTEALLTRNIPKIEETIREIISRALSFWSIDKKRYREKTYQLTLAGFMYGLEGTYYMHTEVETGTGRSDIMLEPVKSGTAYIFELKMESNSEEPLKQIEDNNYEDFLVRRGFTDIVKMGIIFDGKNVEFVN